MNDVPEAVVLLIGFAIALFVIALLLLVYGLVGVMLW